MFLYILLFLICGDSVFMCRSSGWHMHQESNLRIEAFLNGKKISNRFSPKGVNVYYNIGDYFESRCFRNKHNKHSLRWVHKKFHRKTPIEIYNSDDSNLNEIYMAMWLTKIDNNMTLFCYNEHNDFNSIHFYLNDANNPINELSEKQENINCPKGNKFIATRDGQLYYYNIYNTAYRFEDYWIVCINYDKNWEDQKKIYKRNNVTYEFVKFKQSMPSTETNMANKTDISVTDPPIEVKPKTEGLEGKNPDENPGFFNSQEFYISIIAVTFGLFVSIVGYIIFQSVKKKQASSINIQENAQVVYAELQMSETSAKIEKEETPYAQIIGVMKSSQLK